MYVGEDQKYFIRVLYWRIPLGHEILNVKKHLTRLKIYLVSISALELNSASKNNLFAIQYQKLLIILRIPLFHFIE